MTPRERLLTAMHKDTPDRVPLYIRGVQPDDEIWLAKKDASFERLADYVGRHCDLKFKWDPIGDRGRWLTTVSGIECERKVLEETDERTIVQDCYRTPAGEFTAVHQTVQTPTGPLTRTCKQMLETLEDVKRFMSIPYVPPQPDASGFDAFEETVGERGIIEWSVPPPIAIVYRLFDPEQFAFWSLDHRTLIMDMLAEFAKRATDYLHCVLSQGVRPVVCFSGEELVAPPVGSPRDFKDFVVRFEKPLFEIVHSYGCLVHVHCHGYLNAILEHFAEMEVDVLHPVETKPMGDITLEEFRRRLGNAICIEGDIQIGDLYTDTPEEIRAKCRHTIEHGGRDGALILAPTASPYTHILPDRTFENYKAMIDTALEFGRYS